MLSASAARDLRGRRGEAWNRLPFSYYRASVFPVLLKFGPFTVYSFGVLMALGFYFGSLVSVKEFERRGGDGETLWNLLVWVFLGGLVSSRVLSIFNNPSAFFESPLSEIFAGAGFVWYGGFLGGAATAWLLGRRKNLAFLTLADCCALGLALGQAFGRVGCHVAGDGDWGKVTDLPWGVAYTHAIVGWSYPDGVLVHPTPLYEVAAYLALFAFLWRYRHRNPPTGSMFAVYLIGNGFARFWVEFLRIEPVLALGLTQAQWIGMALTAAGAIWLLRRGPAVNARATAVGLAALLLVVPLGGCDSKVGVSEGDLAPDFILQSADGQTRKLSNYRGHVVLVNLWATWCPPCMEEMPVLNQLAERYRDKGLVVLGLAGDDDPQRVRDFVAKSPLKFEVLLDSDGAIGTQYGITGYPETFFIDREGRVRDKIIGAIPGRAGGVSPQFAQRLESLLGG